MSFKVKLFGIHKCVHYHLASSMSGAEKFEGPLRNLPQGSDCQLSVNHSFTQQEETILNNSATSQPGPKDQVEEVVQQERILVLRPWWINLAPCPCFNPPNRVLWVTQNCAASLHLTPDLAITTPLQVLRVVEEAETYLQSYFWKPNFGRFSLSLVGRRVILAQGQSAASSWAYISKASMTIKGNWCPLKQVGGSE